MIELSVKALLGAMIVIIIHFFSKTSNFFIAGLLPLFPSLALVAHVIIGTSRPIADLKTTALFGVFSMIPYLGYLLSVIFCADKFRLFHTLIISVVVWCLLATLLILTWKKYA